MELKEGVTTQSFAIQSQDYSPVLSVVPGVEKRIIIGVVELKEVVTTRSFAIQSQEYSPVLSAVPGRRG